MGRFLHLLSKAWLASWLVLFSSTLCLGQVQYATSVVSALNTGLVVDELKAVDGDLTTNATITPGGLLGFTRLRVSFSALAQANKEAGIYLRPGNPLLNLALLSTASVNTYLQTGTTTTAVESFPLNSNLLSLSLLTNGLNKAAFTPTRTFNQVELVFSSVLSLGQDIGFFEAYSTPVAPLPVVLTDFRGKATSTGVALQWQTASEHNTSHFVVERAVETGGAFQTIGQVQSMGNSTQIKSYQLLDSAPDLLNYYRLRQVDLDGTKTFSPVVAVRVLPNEAVLAAYPSPATEWLTVAGPVGTVFTVVDQSGRRVGGGTITAARLPQLDVSNLPVGLYVVQDAATGKRTKFMKAMR